MEYRLSDDQQAFNRFYKEMDELYHEIALKMGLSDSAFVILYTLCTLGDGCLQRDICGQAFMTKQTIHSSIWKLERAGYLRLEPGRGRDKQIFLTSEGRKVVAEKIFPVIEMERRTFERMTSQERKDYLRLTEKILGGLREESSKIL